MITATLSVWGQDDATGTKAGVLLNVYEDGTIGLIVDDDYYNCTFSADDSRRIALEVLTNAQPTPGIPPAK